MSEFKNIQRLIRLKKFEQPGEEFHEEFLRNFHQRQRAEMLQRSSLKLLWERTATWWSHWLAPKWGMIAAAVAVGSMSIWMLFPSATKSAAAVTTVSSAVPPIDETLFILKMDLSDFPTAPMAGRGDATIEAMLLRKHLETRPALERNAPTLPVNGWQIPRAQNAAPALYNGAEGKLGR